MDRITKEQSKQLMAVSNAFTCTGAYAVLIMSGLKRVENRSMMPVPAKGRCAMSEAKPHRRRTQGRGCG